MKTKKNNHRIKSARAKSKSAKAKSKSAGAKSKTARAMPAKKSRCMNNQKQGRFSKARSYKKEIILFTAKYCTPCRNMKGAWNRLRRAPDKGVRYQKLEKTSVDFLEKKYDLERAHGVDIMFATFPHLVKVACGKLTEYRGDRSEADMRKWVRSAD